MAARDDVLQVERCSASGRAVERHLSHKRHAGNCERTRDRGWGGQGIALRGWGRADSLGQFTALVALFARLEDVCSRGEGSTPNTYATLGAVNPNFGIIRGGEGDCRIIGTKGYLFLDF